MRDALSLTDQALAFGDGHIEYQAVLKMLGTIDNSHLYYLLHFIASGNVEKVFQKIEEFVQLGADFAKLHQELAALCHQVALQQLQNRSNAAEKAGIQLLAERLTPEEIQLYYQIAVQGYKDYTFAPNGKIAFEMTVMRLLAFKPANYIALDESVLTAAPLKETQEVGLAQHIESAATADIDEQAPAVPVQDAVVATPPVAEATSNAEAAVDNLLAAREETATQANNALPQEQIEPVQQITHSRNMLRSHRLKREQEKKSLAATVKQTAEMDVAEKTTTAVNHSSEQSVVENTVAVKEMCDGGNSENPPAVLAEQEMRPVAIAADSASAESADLEELPFADQLPPVESYLQDNFSETDAFAVDTLPEQQTGQDTFVQTAQTLPDAAPLNLDVEAELNEQSVFSHELLEISSIDISQYVADKLTDPWSLAIQQMQLLGLVKLLAKNCVMQQVEQQIILTLKAEQQHLLNDSKICEQLQDKLRMQYGKQISMYIEVGSVPGQLTPVESEQHIFQQYLDMAKQSIREDNNIKAWIQEYGAKVYENSIIPL
jgi:DNA polymerase-3 subunit gamma/tau